MPRIEADGASASAFTVETGRFGFGAPPERENKAREHVSVKYHAPVAGTHTATLVLPTELGELRVELKGHAMDIGNHAKTLATGGGPEPVHDLADKKPTSLRDGRALAMDAADALSSLARTVDATISKGDPARDRFGAQLLAAGASLNTKILSWVHEEGLDRVEAMKHGGSNAADFIKSASIKVAGATLKALSKENILTEYALEAIDLGLSIYFGRKSNQQAGGRAREYGGHMGDVMGFAVPATDAATKALAMRYASLMTSYAEARRGMIDVAGIQAQRIIGDLHTAMDAHDLKKLALRIDDAHRVLADFKVMQSDCGQALKVFAAEGIKAQSIVDTGFSALMEKYVDFRAGGNREIADHERTVTCTGWIDFSEPWNIQHTGFTFGKFSDPATTVKGHLEHNRLAELGAHPGGNPPRPGWDVSIRLTDVRGDGAVVLKQGAAGPGVREAKLEGGIEGRLRAIGGIEKLWSLLDSGTLGTHVIWGGKR